MDYRKTAQEILNHVGGSKNIVSAAHCATRLRLVIADNTKADKTALENVDGVKGVFEASGQLQIILGTGTVNKVFDEFIAIAGITASTKAETKEAAAKKQNWFMKAIKLLGDIFVPIIPAIVASGFRTVACGTIFRRESYERINQRPCKIDKYNRRKSGSKRTDIRRAVPREAAPDASGWLAQRSERTLSDGWCVPRIFPVLPI